MCLDLKSARIFWCMLSFIYIPEMEVMSIFSTFWLALWFVWIIEGNSFLSLPVFLSTWKSRKSLTGFTVKAFNLGACRLTEVNLTKLLRFLSLNFLTFPFAFKCLPILNLSQNCPWHFYIPHGLERVENPYSINLFYYHITTAKLINKNTLDPALAFKNEFLLHNTFRLSENWIKKNLAAYPLKHYSPKLIVFVARILHRSFRIASLILANRNFLQRTQ